MLFPISFGAVLLPFREAEDQPPDSPVAQGVRCQRREGVWAGRAQQGKLWRLLLPCCQLSSMCHGCLPAQLTALSAYRPWINWFVWLQSEALNAGGELYRKDVEGMRMRVVHGNTLTAAAILHRLPEDCDEVFLTGGTSKLGRAIALYLVRKGVRVLVSTSFQGWSA